MLLVFTSGIIVLVEVVEVVLVLVDVDVLDVVVVTMRYPRYNPAIVSAIAGT
jgi:hypothetical protein